MPRPVRFKPYKAQLADGRAPWALNIPAEFSDNGKRQRLFFASEKEAKARAEEFKARRHNFGASLGNLTSSQIVEAADCYQLLSTFPDARLKDAVLAYLETLRARSQSIPFLDLFNQYLNLKQNRSPIYLEALRATRNRFPSLHALPACDVTAEMLEALLQPISPAARNATMRYWRAVLRYGIKRGYLKNDPIERMDFIELARREVEIFSVDEVQRLLTDALENDIALLPFLVLGFFCGIRPEGELSKLEWRDIDFGDRTVTIRPEVSKTKRRRFPILSQNAVAWLSEYQLRGGEMEGRVMPWKKSMLRNHRIANRERAGVTHWPQQGMRHSFCSYWLALHQDVNNLVLLSGHNNPDTMWRHYHKGVQRSEAEKFWAIVPAATPENLVAFSNPAA
jgi:integrase